MVAVYLTIEYSSVSYIGIQWQSTISAESSAGRKHAQLRGQFSLLLAPVIALGHLRRRRVPDQPGLRQQPQQPAQLGQSPRLAPRVFFDLPRFLRFQHHQLHFGLGPRGLSRADAQWAAGRHLGPVSGPKFAAKHWGRSGGCSFYFLYCHSA